MKNLKSVILMFALFIGFNAFAGNEKATIKTSAQCEMCKETLEASIGKLPGVSKVLLNIDSKELMVKFDNSVISLDDIKEEITNTGYWADEMMPNKDAYAALPTCCKPKKACCAAGAGKSSCSKDAAAAADKKACEPGCAKTCCAGKTEGTAPAKKECTGHTH